MILLLQIKASIFRNFMPYKDNDVRRAYQKAAGKKYYEANKEKVKAASRVNKERARANFQSFKATLSCTQCGQNHPATLDFHHVVSHPDNQKINVLTKGGAYTKAIQEIMDKCIVLCANCHRIHHHNERAEAKEKLAKVALL
jgi:hypothetical protein